MAGKTLVASDVKHIRTTTALRALLAHNNKIDTRAIKALQDRGIATPRDVTSRCTTPLCGLTS